jgi:hypothetical protein
MCAMIVGKIVRVVVGVRMPVIGGLVTVFVMAVRPAPVAVIVDGLVRMTAVLRLSRAGLAFLQQNFGVTASAYAAHQANSVSKTDSPSSHPTRAKAPNGPEPRPSAPRGRPYTRRRRRSTDALPQLGRAGRGSYRIDPRTAAREQPLPNGRGGAHCRSALTDHDKEAKRPHPIAEIYARFTVQTWAGIHWTDDPTFNAQYQRIAEGLRKTGVPKGQAKTAN